MANKSAPVVELGLHPFVGQDLISALGARATHRGDTAFLIWAPRAGEAQQFTYAQFAEASQRVAAGLSERGVDQTSRVVVLLDNSPELLLTLFACAWLGATAVTINTASVADEIAYFVEHSCAAIAVTQPSYVDAVQRGCPSLDVVVTSHNGGELARVPDDVAAFDDLARSIVSLAPRQPDPGRDLFVQYTSGTTARPKGVVWTHANALWAGQVNARHTGLRPDDVYLVHLPLFHTNALGYSALGTFWAGSTMVLMPKFSARRFWPTSLHYGCTVTSMIPFCWKTLMSQPVPDEHRYRTWGSPVCDPPFDAHFRVKSVGWWGMTETISHGIVGDPEQPNTPLTCGRPAAEYEIRILDDNGAFVAPGQTGALEIKGVPGVSLFARYLNDEAATRAAFTDDGFFMTGDRVTLLADGHIRFADRDKDMMKVAGENVAASEVERVILAVAGVAEVAVVAKPDPIRNEVPVAFVIVTPAADVDSIAAVIAAQCRDKLAAFKVPADIVIVDELPRSTLNKVAKAELRKRLL
jgi:carnitine-CoA ligase